MNSAHRIITGLTLGVAAAVAAIATPVGERIQVEWRLPVYINSGTATLVLVRVEKNPPPLRLIVRFTERTTAATPTEPLAVLLPENRARTEVRIAIANWPDGEYLTTIGEPGHDADALIRVLRKQTFLEPRPPRGPIDVRGASILFVDDRAVAERHAVTRRAHPAETFAVTSEMLGKDSPYQNATEMFFDADGFLAVRFYTMDRRKRDHRWFIARSHDLAHWDTRPSERRAKSPTDGAACSRVYVPWRWHDPQGKKALYRLYDPTADGPVDLGRVHIQYSGWGGKSKTWGDIPIAPRSTYPVWRKSDKKYILLRQRPLTRDRHKFSENDPGEWPDSNDNWGGQWRSADGKSLHFCQARVAPRHPPFRVPYDNIPGSRLLVAWSTTDGLDWRPTWCMTPDESDPGGLQFYGAYGFWAERKHLRLAYAWVYDSVKQRVYLELVYSRDSRHWHRLSGHPELVANGPVGAWDSGLVAPVPAPPLEHGDHVYHLLRGLNRPHFFLWNGLGPKPVTAQFLEKRLGGTRRLQTWPFWKDIGSWERLADFLNSGSFTLGVMRQRRDGWVSLDVGDRVGTVVTKVLRTGRTLRINARTRPGGFILIEVLDAERKPIPSYCGGNTATFSGDATNRLVAWGNGKVTQLPTTPARFRLRLRNASLFGLQF